MASYSPQVTLMAVFISLILLLIKSVISDCVVKNVKTNVEEPCVFPFKLEYTSGNRTLKSDTFNSCTSFKDPDGKFWCSTKVCTCTVMDKSCFTSLLVILLFKNLFRLTMVSINEAIGVIARMIARIKYQLPLLRQYLNTNTLRILSTLGIV